MLTEKGKADEANGHIVMFYSVHEDGDGGDVDDSWAAGSDPVTIVVRVLRPTIVMGSPPPPTMMVMVTYYLHRHRHDGDGATSAPLSYR